MYKLRLDNVIKETASESKRDQLIAQGYKLVTDDDKDTAPEVTDKVPEDEVETDKIPDESGELDDQAGKPSPSRGRSKADAKK